MQVCYTELFTKSVDEDVDKCAKYRPDVNNFECLKIGT